MTVKGLLKVQWGCLILLVVTSCIECRPRGDSRRGDKRPPPSGDDTRPPPPHHDSRERGDGSRDRRRGDSMEEIIETDAPVILNCTFDSDPWCGMIQESNDDFDWLRRCDPTDSEGTGPEADHTTGNEHDGYFLYIEASSPRREGDVAKLSTGNLRENNPSDQLCLVFYYNMEGRNMGQLKVLGNADPDTVLFEESGDKGGKWKRAFVDIAPEVFTATFEATVGRDYESDMAIDDIIVYRTTCNSLNVVTRKRKRHPDLEDLSFVTATPVLSCTFDEEESPMCGLSQSTNDEFDWSRTCEPTDSENTGPDADHTTKQLHDGYYLYIEASSPRRNGDSAKLLTPNLPGADHCLVFFYMMYGQELGNFSVVQMPSGNRLWSTDRNERKCWKRAALEVDSTTNYLVFEATVGQDYLGDIALDDLVIFPGTCQDLGIDSKNKDHHRDVSDGDRSSRDDQDRDHRHGGSDGDRPPRDDRDRDHHRDGSDSDPPPVDLVPNREPVFECTFDDNANPWCGMSQSSDDLFDWSRTCEPTDSAGTGPDTDHTTQRRSDGYYLYIEASSPRRQGDISSMYLPDVFSRSETSCLTFFYNMNGRNMGSLKVKAESVTEALWEKSGNKGKDWKSAVVDVSVQGSRVYFEAEIGADYESDVAIDDVSVYSGSCDEVFNDEVDENEESQTGGPVANRIVEDQENEDQTTSPQPRQSNQSPPSPRDGQSQPPPPPPSDGDRRQPPPSDGDRRQPPPSDGDRRQPPPSDGDRRQSPPSDGDRRQPPPSDGDRRQSPPSDGDRSQPPPRDGQSQPPPPPRDGHKRPPPPPNDGNNQTAPPPRDGENRPPPPRDGDRRQPPPSDGDHRQPPPRDGYRRQPPPRDGQNQTAPPPRDGHRRPPPPPRDGLNHTGEPVADGIIEDENMTTPLQPRDRQSDQSPPPPKDGENRPPPPPRDGHRRPPPPPRDGQSQPPPPKDGHRRPPPPNDRTDKQYPPHPPRRPGDDKEEKLEIRLTGGDDDLEGRIEVKYNDVWGTVCSDGFGPIEAHVACHVLGFRGPAEVIENVTLSDESILGEDVPIWLDGLRCKPHERSLARCCHNEMGVHDCTHQQDVYIRCSNDSFVDDGMWESPDEEMTEMEEKEDESIEITENIPLIQSQKRDNFVLFQCDFENTDLCEMSQETNDKFDWLRNSMKTDSDSTGPDHDHTTGQGYYIHIDTSGKRLNDNAIIRTPEIDIEETSCLRFWYHMYGRTMGSLSVYQEIENSGTTIWQENGDQGNTWHQALATVKPGMSHIAFEATSGNWYMGDIAIDDIEITTGLCEI